MHNILIIWNQKSFKVFGIQKHYVLSNFLEISYVSQRICVKEDSNNREKLNQFPIKPSYHFLFCNHSLPSSVLLKTFLTSCQCIALISSCQLKQLVKDSLSFNFKIWVYSMPSHILNSVNSLDMISVWTTMNHQYCFLGELYVFCTQYVLGEEWRVWMVIKGLLFQRLSVWLENVWIYTP